MKVALVYDRVNKWGGAERVLLALHELYPAATLYTSVYSARNAKWARVFPKIVPSFLQKIPFLKDNHELIPFLMPLAFESFDFSDYDLVISVTSEAAKGIITKVGTVHVCYCLTPTRYLWSGYNEYFKNSFLRIVAKPIVNYLRRWDGLAAQRPDEIIVISKEVEGRIKRYYSRDSRVVFPPVDIKASSEKKKGNFFLVVSRLVSYKKVDLVIEAFNELGLPLVIVGTGKEEERLKRIAKDNVKFVGFVSEEELVDFYQRARALVFPQEEDFGLTAVEAQSFGTPVIAYKAGGVMDTVIDGITGIFFEEQNKKSLMLAIKRFDKMKFKSKVLKENVKRFSKNKFKKSFFAIVKNL